jgi:hypothetical protein
MNEMTNELAAAWGIDEEQAERVCAMLGVQQWAAGEPIVYAGTIDNGTGDMVAGHNGYWVADDEEHIAFTTNGDAVWADWDEDTAAIIGVQWGEFAEVMGPHKI